ncbi:Elongation factor G [subsurface metagenome]
MKAYTTDQIKNIILVGNAGAGKTTLAEAMLFKGKIIDRRGEVDHKNTASDYREIEHENGNSIFSSLLYTEFNNTKVNILDVPGLDDFIGGLTTSIAAADTAIMVLNGQNGIEVGAEIHNRYLGKANKPMLIAVNHLDHEKVNFEKTIEMTKERFGNAVTIIQYPVNAGVGFNTVIDVLTMKMYKFGENGKMETLDIPDDEADRAAEYQNELVEKAAENDESLMELFFENDGLTEEEMRKGIAVGLINRGMFPVFCLAAKKNMGVERLLQFISNVVPSPNQLPPPKDKKGNEIICDASGPTTLFVFKSSVEQHIGEVMFFKVMSGTVKEGMDLTNMTTLNKERIAEIKVPA